VPPSSSRIKSADLPLLTAPRLVQAVCLVDPLTCAVGRRTLTMKQARRTLEKDLGLTVKYLDDAEWKDTVNSLVDTVSI
jgi:hypothetical protein